MASIESEKEKNALKRLASLPLVSSTCFLVLFMYHSVVESHPYVRPVCQVATTGMKALALVAVACVRPIVNKLEPQMADANQLMCKYLDKTEKAMPILHQPIFKVIADSSNVLTKARSSGVEMVNSAKQGVSFKLSSAAAHIQDTVQDSTEMAKSVVSSGVVSVVNVMGNVVEHYLPHTEEDEDDQTEKLEDIPDEPNGYVQLSSSKLRKRDFHPGAVGNDRLKHIELVSHKAPSGLTQLLSVLLGVVSRLNQNIQLNVLSVAFSAHEVCSSFSKTYPMRGLLGVLLVFSTTSGSQYETDPANRGPPELER